MSQTLCKTKGTMFKNKMRLYIVKVTTATYAQGARLFNFLFKFNERRRVRPPCYNFWSTPSDQPK